MIANRELTLEDYLAIARRRLKIVIVPALIASLIAFLLSFAFTPKYTSQSLLLVEPQIVPAGYVKPIITEHISDRMTTLEQNVLSRSRLRLLVDRLGLVAKGKTEEDVIERIRANVQIQEADPSNPRLNPHAASYSSASRKDRSGQIEDVTGFFVSFAADNPRDAQQVCAEITSMLQTANLELRRDVAQSTTDFLSLQVQQAKGNLDELDQRLAHFKEMHLGRLPSDDDKNIKILMGLTSQLDATTQALSRAQQDKAFAESELAQELAAWKSGQASPNIPPLRQRLIALEDQLVELKGRYTEDYPDVQKTEKDIADIKARLKEMNSAPAAGMPATSAKSSTTDVSAETAETVGDVEARAEPLSIRQLREQIHENGMTIERANVEEKRLDQLIQSYRDRLSLSPEIEEEYKQLTRDYETAHTIYNNLLTNESAAQVQAEMERKQQGEQIKLLDPATLPDSPSFPVRWMFALVGLGVGLGLGACVAFWQELRDRSIRDERDVLAALELPMLASVPWLSTKLDDGGTRRSLQAGRTA